MSAIGKGGWVQCVNTQACETGREVVKGRTYHVEGVGEAYPHEMCGVCMVDRAPVLVLTDAVLAGYGWCSCLFRPLGGSALTRERAAPQDVVTEWERKLQEA